MIWLVVKATKQETLNIYMTSVNAHVCKQLCWISKLLQRLIRYQSNHTKFRTNKHRHLKAYKTLQMPRRLILSEEPIHLMFEERCRDFSWAPATALDRLTRSNCMTRGRSSYQIKSRFYHVESDQVYEITRRLAPRRPSAASWWRRRCCLSRRFSLS